MKFAYAFQKIVDLKSSEKTQAVWGLSSAIGRLQEEENKLEALETKQADVHKQLADMSQRRAKASELLVFQQYLDHLERRINHQTQQVAIARNQVDKQQAILAEKVKEEKVWLKAREKAYLQFNAEMLKQEQEQLDEVAVTRYKR